MMNPKPSIMAEYALVLHQGNFNHRDTESAKVSLGGTRGHALRRFGRRAAFRVAIHPSSSMHRDHLERSSQFIGDPLWPTALAIHINPNSFSFNQHSLVVRSPDQILARRASLSKFGNPGPKRNRFAGESWMDVGDEVRAHNPNRSVLKITFHRPASRG